MWGALARRFVVEGSGDCRQRWKKQKACFEFKVR